MNYTLFNKLMKPKPFQFMPEWRTFLEVCQTYLRRCKVKDPIVVELGSWKNRQKKFYEKLLGAQHIGIDYQEIVETQSVPDILGNTHDEKTIEALKVKLDGKPINILFIDASHHYEDVKKDYEMYSPLCDGIVAIHDIESFRNINIRKSEVWKFWDELKAKASNGEKGYTHSLFLSIHQHRAGNMGIGVILKQ